MIRYVADASFRRWSESVACCERPDHRRAVPLASPCIQYDARDKYQSLVWGERMSDESTQIATPLSGESRSKLRQVVRDSLQTLQLAAASRVPGDVIK